MKEISNTIFPCWYVDGVLSQEECEGLIQEIDSRGTDTVQAVEDQPKLYNLIYDSFQKLAPGVASACPKKIVTISKNIEPVLPHKDGSLGATATHKLAVYLNDLSDRSKADDDTGGTRFHSNFDSPEIIAAAIPRVGRAILFDLREWHSGGPIPEGRHKYMVGIRVSLN